MWNLDFGFKEISAMRQNCSEGGGTRKGNMDKYSKAHYIHGIIQSKNHSLVQLIYESKEVLNWWRD